MRKLLGVLAAALAVAAPARAASDDPLHRALSRSEVAQALSKKMSEIKDGKEAFKLFVEEAREALGRAAPKTGEWLDALATGDVGAPAPEDAWSALLSRYVALRYGQRVVWTTQKLVNFETVNPPGGDPPRQIAAFRDMNAELRGLAGELGLLWSDNGWEAWTARTGDRPDPIVAVTHADVVPAGEGKWAHDPFKAEIAGDALWGRGSLDDKSAIAAHFYAMRALLDAGLPTSRDVELVIGLDEETSWAGFKSFMAKRKAPSIAYVADAWFPAVVGEKGVLNLAVSGPRRAAPAGTPMPVFRLESFESGSVANIVPAKAKAKVQVSAATLSMSQIQSALDGYIIRFNRAFPGVRIDYSWDKLGLWITAQGSAAHGARPWEGKNAATHLLKFCEEYLKMDAYSMGDLPYWVATRVGVAHDGGRLGIFMRDPKMGEATASVGVVDAGGEGPDRAVLNIRWPVGKTAKEMGETLRTSVAAYNKETGAALSASTSYEFDPILVDEDTDLVRTLVEAYRWNTDGLEDVVYIEGNTYAKAIPGAVSFGPNFVGSGLKIHAADERIPLDHLRRLLELYTDALYRLTR